MLSGPSPISSMSTLPNKKIFLGPGPPQVPNLGSPSGNLNRKHSKRIKSVFSYEESKRSHSGRSVKHRPSKISIHSSSRVGSSGRGLSASTRRTSRPRSGKRSRRMLIKRLRPSCLRIFTLF